MQLIPGTIIRTTYNKEPINFFIMSDDDLIQNHHAKGEFYELEELSIIERYFKKGGVFLDIGANIGNHAIFVAKFMFPSQIILIEPNPPAIVILETNIDLNRLIKVADLSMLGIGFSDINGWAVSRTLPTNLGATRLIAQDGGEDGIRLARGDDLLAGKWIDFIKMDVEGLEIKALNGLRKVISSCRPVMFIEVDNENANLFNEFLRESGYVVEERYKRYEGNENFLVVPIETSKK